MSGSSSVDCTDQASRDAQFLAPGISDPAFSWAKVAFVRWGKLQAPRQREPQAQLSRRQQLQRPQETEREEGFPAIAQDCIIAQPSSVQWRPFFVGQHPERALAAFVTGRTVRKHCLLHPSPRSSRPPQQPWDRRRNLGTSSHAQSETSSTPPRALRAAPLPPSPPLPSPTTASARIQAAHLRIMDGAGQPNLRITSASCRDDAPL